MESKKLAFIKDFKLEKSITNYGEGDTIELFSNKYRVISCKNGMTLLKDMRDLPVAYPTEKLNKMLKKSFMQKAIPTAAPSVAPKPQGIANQPASKGPMSGGQKQERQVGEVQNGKQYVFRHGHKYWVNLESGSAHDSHDSSESQPHLKNAEDIKADASMKVGIDREVGKADAGPLKELWDKHTKAVAEADNLQHALSKQTDTSTIERVNNKHQEAKKLYSDFERKFKDAVKKKRRGAE